MKTHWKKAFNPNYIGAWSIEEGQDLIVQIEKAQQEELTNQDGKKENCLVVHLKGQKPMVCNKTNAKTIQIVTGSPYIEDWAGKSIQLYVEQVRAFGEIVPALRVRPVRPSEKKKLTPEQYQRMKSAIESGKLDKVQALSTYHLSQTQQKEIRAL